jgi:hypothetical protein
MVMVFVPARSGMASTVQLVVPVAVPLAPFEVLQIIEAIPDADDAVPETASADVVTANVTSVGFTIVSVGGAPADPVVGCGGGR